MHLSAFFELPGHALQRLLAVNADQRTMPHDLIGIGNLPQGAPRMSRLPSCRLLAPLTLPPRPSLQTITRRRFAAVVAIFGHLSFHLLQPFCQLRDLLVGLG